MGKVELYDKRNIEFLSWPDTDDGQYAKKYLMTLVKDGVSSYIANVNTGMMVIKMGEIVLPVTVNEAEYENSYVCSPYTHYISYALEELRELKQPALEKMLSVIIRGIGFLFRKTEFNKVVHVNNWLLSTNLYPALTDDAVVEIVSFLRSTFPEHTIIFRSLNGVTNRAVIGLLEKQGYQPVASRQVYCLNLRGGELPTLYDIKKDIKLIASSSYEVISGEQLSVNDIPRITELYNMLYLQKYSYNNPRFTEKFIEHALRTGILTFFVFRKNNRIDAAVGFFERNGVMTTPIVGYDVNQSQEIGLYRLTSIKTILEASRRRVYLNNSSGAAQFKRNRGSSGHIEYSMVYYKHLSWWRRLPWLVLVAVVNNIGVALMKKYRL